MAFSIFILFNTVSFLCGRWIAGKPPVILVAFMAFCTTGVLFRVLLFLRPDLEASFFPHINYIQYHGLWLYVTASAFFGMAIGYLPKKREKAGLLVLFIVVFSYGIYSNLWLIIPESHGRQVFPEKSTHHLTQSSMYTCGPASCAMAVSYFGIRISEREMAARCLTRRAGTSVFNVYRGLKLTLHEDRFAVRIVREKSENLIRKGQVAVIMWSAIQHVICIVGTGTGVVVHDPLRRKSKLWTKAELEQMYNGYAVTIAKKKYTDI